MMHTTTVSQLQAHPKMNALRKWLVPRGGANRSLISVTSLEFDIQLAPVSALVIFK
jgi:hypothetical protein